MDLFNNFARKDVISIAASKYDSNILDNIKDLIKTNPQVKLFLEFNPKLLKNTSENPDNLLCYLDKLGFDIYLIKDKERLLFRLKNLNIDEHANLLCINKEESHYTVFFSHDAEKSGATRSLLDLINPLSAAGHLCHVVIPAHGALEEELKKLPVSYNIQPLTWNLLNCNDINQHLQLVNSEIFTLLPFIKQLNPHVICTNTCVINSGAVIAYLLSIPHVWHVREFGEWGHKFQFLESFENRVKFINQYSDFVISNSNAVQKYYSKYVDMHKSKAVYDEVSVNKPTKHEQIFTNEKAYKILVLGNIQESKRQIDVIKCADLLLQYNSNFEIAIVGVICEPDYFAKLQSSITKDCKDKIKFVDYIDNPSNAIDEADIMIVPSEKEAFGRVVIEGMAFKKIVVATNAGGIPELISDGKNGFLYPSGDVNTLAKIIIKVWKNPDKYKHIQNNAYNFFKENFASSNKYSKQVSTILKDCAKQQTKKNIMQDYVQKFLLELDINLKNKDKIIMNKDQIIVSKDQVITDKDQAIINKDQQIFVIYNSLSWRITKSLRWLNEKFPQPMRLLRKMQTALLAKRK